MIRLLKKQLSTWKRLNDMKDINFFLSAAKHGVSKNTF